MGQFRGDGARIGIAELTIEVSNQVGTLTGRQPLLFGAHSPPRSSTTGSDPSDTAATGHQKKPLGLRRRPSTTRSRRRFPVPIDASTWGINPARRPRSRPALRRNRQVPPRDPSTSAQRGPAKPPPRQSRRPYQAAATAAAMPLPLRRHCDIPVRAATGPKLRIIPRRPGVVDAGPVPRRLLVATAKAPGWASRFASPPRGIGSARIEVFLAVGRDRIIQTRALRQRGELARGRDLVDRIQRRWLRGDGGLVGQVVAVIEREGIDPPFAKPPVPSICASACGAGTNRQAAVVTTRARSGRRNIR